MFFRANFPLTIIALVLREGVMKKAAVLLDFVQITSPQFGQHVQLFSGVV